MGRFLREYGRGSRAETLIGERLEPFFVIAETGAYALEEDIDESAAADAIARAIGRPVTGIIALPSGRMLEEMNRRERAEHVADAGATLKDGLWLRIWREHADALDAALGGRDPRQPIYAAFDRALGWDLRRAFETRFRPVIGGLRWLNTTSALGDLLLLSGWNGVQESLFYGLAFAAAGDETRLEQLTPLIELLPRAVPLCESAVRPGSWLVLTG
ncbi:MAG TPA: hypothetical protein VL500_01080 [Candidatus Eisenbacteria bacterium]|nr:hypothetical protein [Candidatus Eisenbacteria bacterium]